jgi:hypothetical protein
MMKLNFMAVYAKVHVRAFTESNIRATFAKTGIVPYNPDVVTVEMMAPSLETSTTSLLPLGLCYGYAGRPAHSLLFSAYFSTCVVT